MKKQTTKKQPAQLPHSTKSAPKKLLAKYRSKRDFKVTPEPSGETKTRGSAKKLQKLAFVVQKHAASRLHYDFRLEWDGVLKSWAVAKGPSYFPGDKRLAVQVEDHPLEYGSFEGIIPKGEYGGGTVMLWDHGTWEPVGDAAEGLRKGNLKFILHGKKLKGHWVLVRMGGKFANESKPSWLLIKEHDTFERTADDTPITAEEPKSVVSGRDLDAIAKAQDAVWNSRAAPAESKQTVGDPKTTLSVRKTKVTSLPNLSRQLAKLSKESLPTFVPPQLASPGAPPQIDGWMHEIKLDGYRIQGRVRPEDRVPVRLLTRTGLDWTHRLRPIADAMARLPVQGALFDGEVVVLKSHGTTSFADLQAAFQEGAKFPLTYFIFDLLHLNGRNLRNLPLRERKELLTHLLSGLPSDGPIRLSKHMEGNAQAVFDNACRLGAEGIVTKRADSKYVSGRSNSWLKIKCYREQEFVIGGFTLPSNGIHGVGALLLGYYKNGKLIYAGRTGTGFTQKTHRLMRERLDAIERKASPFLSVPAEMHRGVHWVKPALVAQVAFANWTTDNLVRQAAFKGLREDKPPISVQREEGPPMPQTRTKDGSEKEAARSEMSRTKRKPSTAPTSSALPVRLTHPDKVLDLSSRLTKEALANYYAAIAPYMLPQISGRPLSLVRCMHGSGKPCFFQKHANESLPEDVESVDIVDKKTGKPEPYITLSTAKALIELAQLSVMEIHAWGSKNANLEKPDRIVIDLDPDPAIDWKTLGAAAIEVRKRLKSAGLETFLKTTGGKGLHVVAPIRPEHDWADVKQFAHELVLAMEKDDPSLFLTRMTKSARKGKIYLDYLRNERGATSIAAFSPRARDGATVALPLDWRELKTKERPVFRVTDFDDWKKRLNRDPWDAMPKTTQRLKL